MAKQSDVRLDASQSVSGARATWRVPASVPLYAPFFGLAEAPFDLTPNSKFLFLTPRQSEALGNLRYALGSSKGFTLITGEAGTGKTTLLRTALAELGDSTNKYVLLSNPTLGRLEFYEYLARAFGLSAEARTSKARFLLDLQDDVEARFAAGGLTGLVIDEAQSMPHELLEEIRLLGNIETPTTKLLNIVLTGQPELAGRLNDPSLRQLKQRIALRCELLPLTIAETAAYVAGRLRIAGGVPDTIFTREAIIHIHESAQGIPRTINVMCDNAMITAFAAQTKPITVALVEDVCRDFDLTTSEEADEPAVQPEPPPPPAESALARGRRNVPLSVTKPPPPSPPAAKRRFRFF